MNQYTTDSNTGFTKKGKKQMSQYTTDTNTGILDAPMDWSEECTDDDPVTGMCCAATQDRCGNCEAYTCEAHQVSCAECKDGSREPWCVTCALKKGVFQQFGGRWLCENCLPEESI